MPILFLARLPALLKKHWKPILLIGGLGLLYFLYVMNETGWSKKYEELQSIHRDEISAIEKARAEEDAKHEQIELELKNRLSEIESRYNEKQIELERFRRSEVKRIVDQHKNDPRGLAEELSSVTGFRIISP